MDLKAVVAGLATALASEASPVGRRARVRAAADGAGLVRALAPEVLARRRRDPEGARRVARAAYQIARRARSSEDAAEAAKGLGEVLLLLGRPREAVRRLAEAVAAGAPSTRLDAAPSLAGALSLLGRVADARDAIASARKACPPDADPRRLAVLDVTEANLLRRLDRFDAALRLLERARVAFRQAGLSSAVAAVDVNRANILSVLHRFDEADRLYRRAEATHEALGQEASALQAHYNHAYLEFMRGRLGAALDRFGEVRARFEEIGDRRHVALCDLDEAEIRLRLNLPLEAEARAARAAAAFEEAGSALDEARARFLEAVAVRRRKDPAVAAAVLEGVHGRLLALGCESWAAVCRQRQAEARRDAGDAFGAAALAEEAARRLAALGLNERAGRAECLRAAIDLDRGDAEAARARLENVLHKARSLSDPWLLVEAHHRTSLAEAALGRARSAARHALRAVALLERHRVAPPADESTPTFLEDKAAIPRNAVLCLLRLGGRRAEVRAFEMAERGKSLAQLDRPGVAPSGAAAEALCREADALRSEIDGLLAPLPRPEGTADPADALRRADAVRLRERRLRSCLDLLARTDPEAARARRPAAPSLADVLAALPPATTLLEYVSCGRDLLAFVVSAEGLRLVRRDVDPESVRSLVTRARFHVDHPVSGGHVAATRALSDLDRALLSPLSPLLSTANVVVVPDGVVEGAPFHLLGADRGCASDGTDLTVAPSAAALLERLARERPPLAPRTSAVDPLPVSLPAGALAGVGSPVPSSALVPLHEPGRKP